MGEPFLRGTKPKRQHVTPSIDLGSPRSWQTIPVKDVEIGDIVPDFGEVVNAEYANFTDSSFRRRATVRLHFLSGKRHTWEYDEEIFVFTH